jgi:phenylalanyl-tRNA synthetase alpha chain
MVELVVKAALPGHTLRTTAASHPYTTNGLQIDVLVGKEWVEIGECGLASAAVLEEAGLAANVSGLAMGLGLDRLLMLRKGLDDIRLLRAIDPRISSQMLDLKPYRAVSSQPAVRRDLSIAVDTSVLSEDLGDRVRAALPERVQSVEEVLILSETSYEDLPPQAIERLGMLPHQKNLLLRVVLRDLDRSLTHEEANQLRDRIYKCLHEGMVHSWASSG